MTFENTSELTGFLNLFGILDN